MALCGVAIGMMALIGLGADRASAQGAPAPAAGQEPPAATVAANLNISPKRVTFDRADRSATIYIFNQGNGPGTFDISLVDRVMLPDGEIMPAADAATNPEAKGPLERLKSAQTMLVITPRRVTLGAGKGQTVRIRAAPSAAGMPAGEYRTHLTVATIPPPSAGLTADQAANPDSQELRFQINSAFGIAIPVIMRIGAADVKGSIEGASYAMQTISLDGLAPAKPTPVVTFQLVRGGVNSLFGNVEVRSSKERPSADALGTIRGIGVYTEIDKRLIQVALRRPPAPGEQLEISFKDDDTAPGRLVAKTTITAP